MWVSFLYFVLYLINPRVSLSQYFIALMKFGSKTSESMIVKDSGRSAIQSWFHLLAGHP